MKFGRVIAPGLIIAAATVAVLSAGVLRARMAGERELGLCDASLRAGDPALAVVHARRAAGWYAPFAPHTRAYVELRRIAEDALGRSDLDLALFAYRAIRAASIGSRWFSYPHAQDRKQADEAIARLLADDVHGAAASELSREERMKRFRIGLVADERPRAGWGVVLVAGCLLWMGSVGWIALRGLAQDGSIVPRHARLGALALALGMAAWLAGIWFA